MYVYTIFVYILCMNNHIHIMGVSICCCDFCLGSLAGLISYDANVRRYVYTYIYIYIYIYIFCIYIYIYIYYITGPAGAPDCQPAAARGGSRQNKTSTALDSPPRVWKGEGA